MYAYISGKLIHKEHALAILEVNGIGYEIRIPISTHAVIELGKVCKLFTYLHIKEDAHTLFGFANADDKHLFMLLLSISGVGPTTALALLSSMAASELREAIARGEVLTIQKVKGIGTKTAQRIVLELQDKLKKEIWQGTTPPLADSVGTLQAEALAALTILGIPKAAAEKSIQTIIKRHGNDISVEELIKFALKT